VFDGVFDGAVDGGCGVAALARATAMISIQPFAADCERDAIDWMSQR